jgi:hypothetical protein
MSFPDLPCVFMCLDSLEDCTEAYGQSGHLYGFTPVCERRCTVRLLTFLKILPQNSHVSLRFLPGVDGNKPEGVCGDGLEPMSDEFGLTVRLSILREKALGVGRDSAFKIGLSLWPLFRAAAI